MIQGRKASYHIVPAVPLVIPAPEQPGTILQQFAVLLDWLNQDDVARQDPNEWERARRRQLPHARRAG